MRGLLLAALLALPGLAAAQDAFRPHLETEMDLGLYTVGTTRATDRGKRGTSTYLHGELAAGLHLAPGFSIQGVLAFEPIGEGDALGGTPDGGSIFFRRQSAFIDSLFAEWKPEEETTLYAGRFVAPFGRGREDFPGILVRLRADEATAVTDSLGVGGSTRLLSDPVWGKHDIAAAVFTLDRSVLSSTFATRRRCCDERYERFSRNTRAQGGPGNTGQGDNAVMALDGSGFAALPGFSYHVAGLTRGAGGDGTAREWAATIGLRYAHSWTPAHSTLLFAEGAQFRNAGGRPVEELTRVTGFDAFGDPIESTSDIAIRERRVFTTLGVQHRWDEWRGTVAWQRDQRKRRDDPVPTENYLEVSLGRDVLPNVSLDVGYQYGRYAREEAGGLGTAHAILLRVGFRGF